MTVEPEPQGATPPPVAAPPAMPPTPAELAAAIARLEARVAVLEAANGASAADGVEVAKLAWAVKHGRQRPW